MPFLLDTHAWLWALNEPERLPRTVREALTNATERPRLSAISVWEVALLAEKGRISLIPDLDAWMLDAIGSVREVPINFDVAVASRRLRLPHEDPADRFIAAAAQVFELCLITADSRLRRCPDITTLWD